MLPFWLYFLAITSAELLTVFLDPLVGVVCHGMILVALLIQSAFAADSGRRNLILGLSLVPLIRILSLAMPLVQLPQVYWYPIIYAPLLVATVVVMRIVKLKPSDVGLVRHDLPIQILIGVASGFAYGILEYMILRPKPMVWFPAVVLLVTTGFVEELMFRGVLQRLAEPAMGFWQGIIYISLIFAILHIGFFSAVDIIFVLIVALFFAYAVKTTGSLIGVTLSHGIANIFLYLVMPFMLS
jgi:membrane protease YdiL (CAAX protease family)